MRIRRMDNGVAVVEDEELGLKVVLFRDGSGAVSSTRASGESRIFANAEAADEMIKDAQEMMTEFLKSNQRPNEQS